MGCCFQVNLHRCYKCLSMLDHFLRYCAKLSSYFSSNNFTTLITLFKSFPQFYLLHLGTALNYISYFTLGKCFYEMTAFIFGFLSPVFFPPSSDSCSVLSRRRLRACSRVNPTSRRLRWPHGRRRWLKRAA